jgi:hypothetical protein
LISLFLRLPEDPIWITFTLKQVNANYDAASRDGEAQYQELHVQPNMLTPPIYLSPHINGQTFFGKADIMIDGQAFDSELEHQAHHYQAAHRIMCSDSLRKERYGDNYQWVSNRSEMTTTAAVTEKQPEADDLTFRVAKALSRPPNLIKCQNTITPDDTGVSRSHVMRLGFDGVYPFSSSNNILRTITKVKNGNSFLHPGCSLDITLHRRTDMTLLFERTDLTDVQQYQIGVGLGGAPVVAVNAYTPVFKVKISSISLMYESVVLESQEEISRIMRSTLRYPVDVALMRTSAIFGGTMNQVVKVPLPPGTKVAYLMFLHETQTVPNAVQNINMSTRYRYLPGLSKVELSLVGKDGLIFQRGIDDLGVPAGRESLSLRAMHAEWLKKNIYTKPFDTFFPSSPADANTGFDQLLVLDMTPYKKSVADISTLFVTLSYNTMSQYRWNLRVFPVVQRLYEYSEKTRWTWKDTL